MNYDFINIFLESIIKQYQASFSSKVFLEETLAEDELMQVFGITQEIKAGNKQYWGRELGMCWQRLIVELFKNSRDDYRPPIKEGKDEICDLIVGTDAIDTKYRIGSGDSGTLKKFRQYGTKLRQLNFRPILLILRQDSLPHAIKACVTGGWIVKSGDDAYQYIYEITQFDLKIWLQTRKNLFYL